MYKEDKCIYERLDEVLGELKPYKLADYLVMNDIHYAEQLQHEIEAHIMLNDDKLTEQFDIKED